MRPPRAPAGTGVAVRRPAPEERPGRPGERARNARPPRSYVRGRGCRCLPPAVQSFGLAPVPAVRVPRARLFAPSRRTGAPVGAGTSGSGRRCASARTSRRRFRAGCGRAADDGMSRRGPQPAGAWSHYRARRAFRLAGRGPPAQLVPTRGGVDPPAGAAARPSGFDLGRPARRQQQRRPLRTHLARPFQQPGREAAQGSPMSQG